MVALRVGSPTRSQTVFVADGVPVLGKIAGGTVMFVVVVGGKVLFVAVLGVEDVSADMVVVRRIAKRRDPELYVHLYSKKSNHSDPR